MFEEGFKTKRNPLPAAPASQQADLVLTAPFTVRLFILQNQFGRMQTIYWSWAQHPARQENI